MRELVHHQPKQNTSRRRPEVGTQATAAPRDGDGAGQLSENQKAANLPALVLALATFAISTGAFIVTGLIPGVASDFSVSVGTAGHLVTIFAVAYALSSAVLVALTGSVARRRLLVSTLTLSALANVAAAAAPTFSLLLAKRGTQPRLRCFLPAGGVPHRRSACYSWPKGTGTLDRRGRDFGGVGTRGAFGSRARRLLRMAGKLRLGGDLGDPCLHRRESTASEGEKRAL